MGSRHPSVAILACFIVSAAASGLVDNPVVGDALQYLDGEAWIVSNGSITIGAIIPGDLITDLHRGGVIGDPLYETNFLDPVWESSNWTYTLTFDVDQDVLAAGNALLVFDGIKMVADVTLNGAYLGYTADQFLRYEFAVNGMLKPTGNVLTVNFPLAGDVRNNEGRFMACTGGWDWAPYSNTHTANGMQTFSKGIWKSVYVVGYSSVAIEHVVPLVFYNGSYPTAPLQNGQQGPFQVNVRVHFRAAAATTGTLTVTGEWGQTASTQVNVPAGASNATLSVVASPASVKLWWPANMGQQHLYGLTISFKASQAQSPLQTWRRVGFRVFTLVTGNDTDPSTLAGKDGSDSLTMRWKVNGANMFARGGNMIPLEELEGRASALAHRTLVKSAVEAGMNTFRLWGGGIYPYDEWYDACDEYGVLIYHDVMYAQGGHSPAVTPMQDAELRHQIRRISHHPSIAMYDGCNECDGHGIYTTFVMTTILEEDRSRPPWPACPSQGWSSGVDRLWSLANNSPLGLQPKLVPSETSSTPLKAGTCTTQMNADYDNGNNGPNTAANDVGACCAACDANPSCYVAVLYDGLCWFKTQAQASKISFQPGRISVWPTGHGPIPPVPPPVYQIETHGPYQHGTGFKAVNDPDGKLQLFPPNQPPALLPSAATGTDLPGTFASEFGGVAISSFESMAPTLNPLHWGINSPPMSQRNYPVNNFVLSYVPQVDCTEIGEFAFKRQLYLAMLGQALEMKSDIETRRSGNTFGAVTWQLNEIWPTGGWGSLEYGTVGYTAGQIIGGRWKPLHYFMEASAYRDVFVSCGNDGRCVVKNDDALYAFSGTLTVSLMHVATGQFSQTTSQKVSLPRGAGASQWYCADGSDPNSGCTPLAQVLSANQCSPTGVDCVLYSTVTDLHNNRVTENNAILAILGNYSLPVAHMSAKVGQLNPDGTVPISVSSDATALFVTLTTAATGRFSHNTFHLAGAATRQIVFIPFDGTSIDLGLLVSTLRVEHVQQYL